MTRLWIRSFLIGLVLICLNIIVISPSWAADHVTNLTSSSHQISERSNNNEIRVTWDASGIDNLDGFAHDWTKDPATIPATKDLGADVITVTSDSLADGNWYFHIRPVLTVSPSYGTTSHLGPFIIVTVPVGDDWTPKPPKPGDSVTLSGFNLKEGLQISFYTDPGMTDLKATATDVFVIVGDEKHASFTVPQGLSPGTYYLKLQNTDGKTGQVAGFEVVTTVVPGDANSDGNINVLDVIGIINHILDISIAPGTPDCNGDENVNVLDVICVINKILGG